MAIALVKSAKGTSSVATTTAAFGSATTSGNLIVLAFSSDDYNGTPDTGWTQSSEMEQQTFHGGYVWWRISTGQTSFQYTIGSATVSSWVLMEFSGCDSAPYDTSQGVCVAAGGGTYTTDPITPSTGNRLLVAMVGGSHTSEDYSPPFDSWTNSFTAIDSAGQSAGAARTIAGTAYRLVTGDGVTTYSTTADYPLLTSPQSKSALIISFKEGTSARILTADVGTYAVTGVDAGFKFNHAVAADVGTYALTGKDATLLRSGAKIVTADAGSYAVTGIAAVLNRSTSGVTLVQSKLGFGTTATTTITCDSATTSGNLIVLAFASDAYNTTPDAGWNQSTGMEQQATYHGGYVWWRISAGETSFSYTIDVTTQSVFALMEFAGIDPSPYDTSSGQFAASGGLTSYTTPAIAPSTGRRLLVGAITGSSGFRDLNGIYTDWLNSFTAVGTIGWSVAPMLSVGTAYRVITGDGVTAYSTGATLANEVIAATGLLISFKEAGVHNYTVGGESGFYTLSGKDAGLFSSVKKIDVTTGVYALTGNTAILSHGFVLPAVSGVYALTGKDAGALVDGTDRADIILESVDYPRIAGLEHFVVVPIENTAGFYAIVADAGTYALSGQATGFLFNRAIDATQTSYTVTGWPVTFTYVIGGAYSLQADVGNYSVSGRDAGFSIFNKTLICQSGSYELNGNPTTILRWSAERLSGHTAGVSSAKRRKSQRNRERDIAEREERLASLFHDYSEDEEIIARLFAAEYDDDDDD